MPDEWEERHGLDKNNADDGKLVTDCRNNKVAYVSSISPR